MDNSWNFAPVTHTKSQFTFNGRLSAGLFRHTGCTDHPSPLSFRKITDEDMPLIWPYLQMENGHTTDFSYGGLLMWVDVFRYEYAIYEDTLFIKGTLENDLSKTAYSLPVGKQPLNEALDVLRRHCLAEGARLELSAVPESAMTEITALGPVAVEELTDWGDYLYDAGALATLAGKKMSKKRNHVHQFESHCPDWWFEKISPSNAADVIGFLKETESEGDMSENARKERELSAGMIGKIQRGDPVLEGYALYAEGKICAFTIGDMKGDTLFVHVEKATREVPGSYEMVNYLFAKTMTERFPGIRFINREDDAGDMGLRMAKESYHPLRILKKYNVIF